MTNSININDYDYSYSELKKGAGVGEYLYHDFQVWGSVAFKDHKIELGFQTGHSFYCNDFGCPSNDLEFYLDGCDRIVHCAREFEDWDWSDIDDDDKEILAEYDIKSADDLAEFIELLNDANNIADKKFCEWVRGTRFDELILTCSDDYFNRDERADYIKRARADWQAEKAELTRAA